MWLYRANLAVAAPLLWFWSARTFGGERVPSEGPLLVAANHASYLDPWLLGGLFPRRPVRYLINEPWFRRSAAWTRAFEGFGVIPAVAGDPEATIGRVLGALSRGEVVGIFPEGRISRNGNLGPGRSGIGRIAAASGVPVVPCAIRGAFESLPRHRRIPRRHPVHLHIGEPVRFPGAPDPQPDRARVRAFVDGIMASIAGLAAAPPVWNTAGALAAKEAP